jgi:muconolactone delta-isomerase
MKFVVIGSIKESASMFPPSLVRQLVEADPAVISQQKKAGKLLEIYWIPGWNRGIAIREAKSAEEIYRDIADMPCSILTNNEVYPLADYSEINKAMVERLKIVEKMMPTPPK